MSQDAEKHAFGPEFGTPINYGQYVGLLHNNAWLSLDLSWTASDVGDQQSWQVGGCQASASEIQRCQLATLNKLGRAGHTDTSQTKSSETYD